MKKVLLISRAKTSKALESVDAFTNKIRQLMGGDFMIESCDMSELFFELDSDSVSIYHPDKKFDIRDFGLVIIRNVGSYTAEAHAVSAYCEYFDIRYTDVYLNRLLLDNKMSTQFAAWFGGAKSWPRTLYGPVKEMQRRLYELGEKAVLKDNLGLKGRLNFVVSSPEQIVSITEQHPDVSFVLQEFIPNDSDLRILVLNKKASLIIRRTGDGSSHLNNTSQGGAAEVVSLDQIDRDVIIKAEQVAEILKLQVAGVDVMLDSLTSRLYLLEVNNAPQIASGSFVDEKVVVYADMIRSIAQSEEAA